MQGLIDVMPSIMVLDRDPDCQDEVLNIDMDENTIIIHALMDVTVAILSSEYPSGTLAFKAGQVLLLPVGVFYAEEE